MAAMVNMNSLLNGKDSRWLQLEVCREFQRNKCSRQDTECKFAHPPANVEVQNGKVTACYDSIKGRCNRDKPPCKYFHPPQHLKDQLLINGRNHLALKNALMQQMGIAPGQAVIPGQVPAVATNPYLTGIPANTYSPYFGPGHLVPALLGPDPSAVASQLGPVVPQAVQVAQQKIPRSDRLETASVNAATLTHHPTTIPTPVAAAHPAHTAAPPTAVAISQHQLEMGKKRAAENDMFQLMDVKTAFSGMVPYKRPAAEKSGIPVYQPGATTYQQLMQLQQPFVPVSSNSKIPLNASYVIYTDSNGQLLDTLPVCQDFNRSMCSRLNCRFVHLTEDDKVEVCDQRVAVCRDHANGQCRRKQCKYYHIPIVLPPANVMAAIIHSGSNNNNNNNIITTNSKNSLLQSNSPYEQIEQQQHITLQQQPQHITTNTMTKATNPTATISTNYNNNLIIIEPHQQQQQPHQQQHYHYANNSHMAQHYTTTKTIATTPSNIYPTHQHQHPQQQQQYQLHAHPHHSPYSPSSASSSSSCSIATSPTLSSATTLSTTSTATMPTPHIAALTSNFAQPTFLKAAPATITIAAAPPNSQQPTTAFYDLSTPTTPTLLLSSDYNSNCIPILTTPAVTVPATVPTAVAPFIYTATPHQQQQQQQQHQQQHQQQPQQHLIKFTQQPYFHYQQPKTHFQQQQQQQQHPHQFVATQHVAANLSSGIIAATTATASSSASVSSSSTPSAPSTSM